MNTPTPAVSLPALSEGCIRTADMLAVYADKLPEVHYSHGYTLPAIEALRAAAQALRAGATDRIATLEEAAKFLDAQADIEPRPYDVYYRHAASRVRGLKSSAPPAADASAGEAGPTCDLCHKPLLPGQSRALDYTFGTVHAECLDPPAPPAEPVAGHPDGWLLIKRDLYERPDHCGYTGIRDNAGLYSKAEADRHAEWYGPDHVVHISEAPEFRAAAYNDLVIKHLTKQRDEAKTQLAALEAENRRLPAVEMMMRDANALVVELLAREKAAEAERDRLREAQPAPLPSWWRPSARLRQAIEKYRKVRSDLDEFDGDRRGISQALGECEFAILKAISDDHDVDDEGDHNAFVVSPMVKLLDRLMSALASSPSAQGGEHG